MRLDTSILLVNFNSDRFISSTCRASQGRFDLQSNGRCATNKYFQIIGSIHDIESYFGIDNTSSLNVGIFFSHSAHLAIIFVWVSSNLFHIGWNGNYEVWVFNPIATIPIAHGISDPHFALPILDAYSSGKSDYTILVSYSGIYNWLYTLGFNSVFHVYKLSIICELLAVISIPLAKVHLIYLDELLQWLRLNNYGCIYLRRQSGVHKEIIHLHKKLACRSDIKVHPIFIWPFHFFVAYFDLANLRLNFHTGMIIGFLSIAWCGHLVHVAIPISRGPLHHSSKSIIPKQSLHPFFSANWVVLSSDIDKDNHIFSTSVGIVLV